MIPLHYPDYFVEFESFIGIYISYYRTLTFLISVFTISPPPPSPQSLFEMLVIGLRLRGGKQELFSCQAPRNRSQTVMTSNLHTDHRLSKSMLLLSAHDKVEVIFLDLISGFNNSF